MDDDRKNGTRKLYGPNESCFVINAGKIGNVGKYFNHSCEPNIFPQNVFVDTQDLRFPWVAFFAKKFIPAGTELTWDYGYEVGSIYSRQKAVLLISLLFDYANVIAIITLDIPVSFSKNLAPICLPPASTDSNQYVDQNAIVLGWTTGNAKLQQGKVSIVSNDECKMMPTITQYISDTAICINSDTTDVGGPVVVMSSPGTWTLVGINSYTAQTCTSSGLKTRVSAFRSWIDQNMQI